MNVRKLLTLNTQLPKLLNFQPTILRSLSANIMKAPTIKMNNGLEMPAFGLGTWQSAPGEVGRAVNAAIEVGYRHIDCAMVYGNEKEIGEGIRAILDAKIVKREELFITTKLWNTFHEQDKVVDACRKSLENFGLDYIDLYLVHWPVALKTVGPYNSLLPFENAVGYDYDYVKTWKGMEECVKLGLAKSIGISNFNKEQIERVLANCSIKPVTNQIEVNLFNTEEKMIALCKQHDIIVTAYSPFSSPARPWAKSDEPMLDWKNPTLVKIAQKHNKSVGQILLRHLVQLGTVPIPKSTNSTRLRENIDVFEFQLSAEEVQQINSFNVNFRAIKAPELAELPHYPFDNWI